MLVNVASMVKAIDEQKALTKKGLPFGSPF
jgi:hypothetical protein